MTKLQLYITMTQSQGNFNTMVEINPESYVKSWICDLRSVVGQVDYNPSEKVIFYMVKYIDTGMFITVLRTIPKTHGNHLAAWIFIPYTLRISDNDIRKTVDFITQKVSSSEVNSNDIKQMRELFAHDYESDITAPIFAPSNGIDYAYRYYGPRAGVTFQDLIGPFRFQTSYLKKAGVLFVDQDLSADIAGTNLTSAPLDDMAVLLPPLDGNVEGFKPLIYEQPFDVPYYVPMSRQTDIIWHKDGYADIKQTFYVAQAEMRSQGLLETHPSIINSRLAQKAHEEEKTMEAKAKAEEPVLVFESEPVIALEPEPEPKPAEEPKTAPVPSAHQQYVPQQPQPTPAPQPVQPVEPAKPAQPVQPVQPAQPVQTPVHNGTVYNHTVNQEKPAEHHQAEIKHQHTQPAHSVQTQHSDIPSRKKVYKFQIPSKSASLGSMIEFEIVTNADLVSSPIEGYEATGSIQEGVGRSTHLIYKGEDSRKKLINQIIYAVGGFLLGILLTLLCTCGGGSKSDETSDADSTAVSAQVPSSDATNANAGETAANATAATATQAANQPISADLSLSAAVHYLDTNKTWEKEKLESYPDLQGLYDDMNNINRRRIVDYWGPKLKESRTFTNSVVHHADISMKKKAKRNPYNSDSDTKINVQSYLNTIDP